MDITNDADLRAELVRCGIKAGPITDSTRNLYKKKLAALNSASSNGQPQAAYKPVPMPQAVDPPQSVHKSNPKPQAGSKPQAVDPPTSAHRPQSTPKPQVMDPPQSAHRSQHKSLSTPKPQASVDLPQSLHHRPLSASKPQAVYQPAPAADDEDDDHMETSRIVSRFRPSGNFSNSGGSSFGFDSSFTSSARDYRASPADVYSARYRPPSAQPAFGSSLRRISKGAWEFFNPSTTDFQESFDSSRKLFGQFGSKYSPKASSRLSTSSAKKIRVQSSAGGGDSSAVAYCLIGLSVVGVAAVGAYTWTTHPEAVQRGFHAGVDFASTTFNYFYAFLILPLVVVAAVALTAGGIYKYRQFLDASKKEREARLLALVDRVTDIIRDNGSDGIAELHVRDILLPPTKRTNDDWALWKDAAKFINLEDSRVRTELRMVNGDECNVWIWVPITKHK